MLILLFKKGYTMIRCLCCFLILWSLIAAIPLQAQEDRKIVTVDVLPDKVDLKPGQSYRFIARAYNRSYTEVTPFSVEWSCTGGAINQDGVYTAGNNDGVNWVMATHRGTGVQGSAVVVIKGGSSSTTQLPNINQIVRLTIYPSNATLNPGQTIRFEVRGYNTYGQEVRTNFVPNWRVSGGSISPDGYYTAGAAPGSYLVRAQDISTGAFIEAVVNIVSLRGILSTIQIYPRDAKIGAYKEQRFFATGYDGMGNTVPVSPYWEASGGKIDNNGIYIAGGIPGTYYVKASTQGVSTTTKIVIEDAEIARIEINPQQGFLRPRQAIKFQITAFDRVGNVVHNILPLWSANGGIIQADGTYIAGDIPGKYSANVTVGRITSTIPIEIVHDINRPTSIEIVPNNVFVSPKKIIKFAVKAYNQKGIEVRPSLITWTARGGIIEPNGTYQAGPVLGKYLVEANMGDLSAKAWVTITHGSVAKLVLTPDEISLYPGQKNQFFASAYDADGNKVPCALTWSAEGGDISKDGIYTAGNQPGEFILQITTENNIKAKAKINVINVEPQQPPQPPEPDSPYSYNENVSTSITSDTLDSKFFQIILWRTWAESDEKGRLQIQARMISPRGHRIQIVLEKNDGTDYPISENILKRGQAFECTGEYSRYSVQAIKIILWDKHNRRIYQFRREAN